MKIAKLALCIGISLACISCFNVTQKQNETNKLQAEVAPKPIIVGNDSDEHGCKASAGYTWSELLGECIRVWEIGTVVQFADTVASNKQAAYAVFAADSSRVELFSAVYNNPILVRKGTENTWVLDAKNITLQQTPKGWILAVCK